MASVVCGGTPKILFSGNVTLNKDEPTLYFCKSFIGIESTLYKELETQVISDKTTGAAKAKCAEVAANIAIDVLKMESEGIKAVKELAAKNVQGKDILDNLKNQSKENGYDKEKRWLVGRFMENSSDNRNISLHGLLQMK